MGHPVTCMRSSQRLEPGYQQVIKSYRQGRHKKMIQARSEYAKSCQKLRHIVAKLHDWKFFGPPFVVFSNRSLWFLSSVLEVVKKKSAKVR